VPTGVSISGPDFDISATRCGAKVRLILSGELDLATEPQVERHVAAALAAGADLVIDVSQVTFIDSAGLGVLLAAHDRAARHGHPLVVVSGSDAVDHVFAVTDVEEFLTVVRSPGEG
jgi:anti-anti-sigma factor